jgi:hypothetical protein
MTAKTAVLLRFIGPLAIAGGIYGGYIVVTTLQQGSIHFGSLMGPKPLYTREHDPDQFNALIAFLTFDTIGAMVAGIAMSYFGFFKPTNDDPAPPASKK